MKTMTIWVIGGLGLAGCATVSLPAESIAQYEAAARSAGELGGQDVPEAKLHLKLAQDESAAAKRMADQGDDRAYTMITRAQVDAELAVSLAKQSRVHAEANHADEQLRDVAGTPSTQVTP